MPTGTQVGDLLIMVYKYGAFDVGMTVPSGWTLVQNPQLSLAWKVAEIADTASTLTFTSASTRQMAAFVLRISGAAASGSVATSYANAVNAPAVTTAWASANHLAIAVYAQRDSISALTSFSQPSDPAGLTTLIVQPETTSGSTTPAFLIAASKVLENVTSFDPNSWTVTSSPTTQVASMAILVQKA